MTDLAKCPVCGTVAYITKAGMLRSHLSDGRQNDGGNIPTTPRCPGSGKPGEPVERTPGKA